MSLFSVMKRCWQVLPQSARETSLFDPIREVLRNRLASHDEIYNKDYFTSRRTAARQSAEVIGRSVAQAFAPCTVLDVGCATGDLLDVLRGLGISASGLEYSEAALEACRAAGLKVQKFDLEHDQAQTDLTADVVVSTEVAEHLPESCAERYVDLLCRARRSVVFTAAPPGQKGLDHVNLQPREYWINKFAARRLVLDAKMTQAWREQWEKTPIAAHYPKNLMIFHSAS